MFPPTFLSHLPITPLLCSILVNLNTNPPFCRQERETIAERDKRIEEEEKLEELRLKQLEERKIESLDILREQLQRERIEQENAEKGKCSVRCVTCDCVGVVWFVSYVIIWV